MAYSTDVEAAKALATRAHEGQTDKAGRPYITHPESPFKIFCKGR